MADKALVVASFGARGTGKTAWMKGHYAKAPRLAVWDYKHDPTLEGYGEAVRDPAALLDALQRPRFRVRYLVNRAGDVEAQFSLFCRACFRIGNLAMWVDELPMVTRAGRAPPAWRECVNVGRDYRGADGARRALGIGITAQRPAEVDKTLIANLDILHTGRLAYENDARSVSGSLGVPPHILMQLPDLHYVERRADAARATAGVLTFSGNSGIARTKKIRDL